MKTAIIHRRPLPAHGVDPAAFWSESPALDLAETITGQPPQQPTQVRLAADARELRVRFDCADAHPWATLTERDAPLYTEEVVELFVDPVGDLQSYFEIEVNPLGTLMDVVLRRSRSGWKKDFRWRCDGLRSAAAIVPGGWWAELSIPLDSLRPEPPQPGEIWRANFLRIDRPPGVERELSAWSPTLCGTFHVAEKFGSLVWE